MNRFPLLSTVFLGLALWSELCPATVQAQLSMTDLPSFPTAPVAAKPQTAPVNGTEKGNGKLQEPETGSDVQKKDAKGLNDVTARLGLGLFQSQGVVPIDLGHALKLGGAENPQLLIARSRVTMAMAARQIMAAKLLPVANAPGMNFDAHTGNFQQSSGNILNANRTSLYMGSGSNAVAAGTVVIPGLSYQLNVAATYFDILVAKQLVARQQFATAAAKIDMGRRVALAYTDLLKAEGKRGLILQTRDEAQAVAKLTADFAKTGLGREADAERAATELATRQADLIETEGQIVTASARLAQLLNLSPALRLKPVENRVLPTPLVPEPIPVKELIGIALLHRPELAERQADIRAAMYSLQSSKVLPFSPTVLTGLSGGWFGGGSNTISTGHPPQVAMVNGKPVPNDLGLDAKFPNTRYGAATNQSRFGNFNTRNDYDVIFFWTLKNLGVANVAFIRQDRARLHQSELQKVAVFNEIRSDVVQTYVRAQVALRKVDVTETAVREAMKAYDEDYKRVRGNLGLPIELLTSLRLLWDSRQQYLDAIVDYNQAQIELYSAIGQPPADVLAHPAPVVNLGMPTYPLVAPAAAGN